MPTYEYECVNCRHKWEIEQNIKSPPIKKCHKCHKNTAKRLISGGSGFILNGGGWAKDGYKSK